MRPKLKMDVVWGSIAGGDEGLREYIFRSFLANESGRKAEL